MAFAELIPPLFRMTWSHKTEIPAGVQRENVTFYEEYIFLTSGEFCPD